MAIKVTTLYRSPVWHAQGKNSSGTNIHDKQLVVGTIQVDATNSNVTTGNPASVFGLEGFDAIVVQPANNATDGSIGTTAAIGYHNATTSSLLHLATVTFTTSVPAIIATNVGATYILSFVAVGPTAYDYKATHTPV